MEPLHSYQGEHYEEEHTKPHIVYRKSAPKKQTSGENSACDTSGMVFCMRAIYTDQGVTHLQMHIDNTNKHRCNLDTSAVLSKMHMHSYCMCSKCYSDLITQRLPSVSFLAAQLTVASEHRPPKGFMC